MQEKSFDKNASSPSTHEASIGFWGDVYGSLTNTLKSQANGAIQLSNHVLGTNLNEFQATKVDDPNSSWGAWSASLVGQAAAMSVELLGARKLGAAVKMFGGSAGTTAFEAESMSSTTAGWQRFATGLSAKDTPATQMYSSLAFGGVLGGVLTPSNDTDHFWQSRFNNAASGMISMGAMTGISLGSAGLAARLPEGKIASTLANGYFNNAVGGYAGGVLGDLTTSSLTGKEIDWKQANKSGVEFALIGMGAHTLNMLPGYRAATYVHTKFPFMDEANTRAELKRLSELQTSKPKLPGEWHFFEPPTRLWDEREWTKFHDEADAAWLRSRRALDPTLTFITPDLIREQGSKLIQGLTVEDIRQLALDENKRNALLERNARGGITGDQFKAVLDGARTTDPTDSSAAKLVSTRPELVGQLSVEQISELLQSTAIRDALLDISSHLHPEQRKAVIDSVRSVDPLNLSGFTPELLSKHGTLVYDLTPDEIRRLSSRDEATRDAIRDASFANSEASKAFIKGMVDADPVNLSAFTAEFIRTWARHLDALSPDDFHRLWDREVDREKTRQAIMERSNDLSPAHQKVLVDALRDLDPQNLSAFTPKMIEGPLGRHLTPDDVRKLASREDARRVLLKAAENRELNRPSTSLSSEDHMQALVDGIRALDPIGLSGFDTWFLTPNRIKYFQPSDVSILATSYNNRSILLDHSENLPHSVRESLVDAMRRDDPERLSAFGPDEISRHPELLKHLSADEIRTLAHRDATTAAALLETAGHTSEAVSAQINRIWHESPEILDGLERLNLDSWDELKQLPPLPASLTRLDIVNCKNLESLSEPVPPHLNSLFLKHLPKLKALPEGLSHWGMDNRVVDCPHIEEAYGGAPWLEP